VRGPGRKKEGKESGEKGAVGKEKEKGRQARSGALGGKMLSGKVIGEDAWRSRATPMKEKSFSVPPEGSKQETRTILGWGEVSNRNYRNEPQRAKNVAITKSASRGSGEKGRTQRKHEEGLNPDHWASPFLPLEGKRQQKKGGVKRVRDMEILDDEGGNLPSGTP